MEFMQSLMNLILDPDFIFGIALPFWSFAFIFFSFICILCAIFDAW